MKSRRRIHKPDKNRAREDTTAEAPTRLRYLLIVAILLGAIAAVIAGWQTLRIVKNPRLPPVSTANGKTSPLASALKAPIPVEPTTDELVGEGKDLANELATTFSEDAAALALSGRLSYTVGDSTSAMQRWHKSLNIDPLSAEALLGMAEYNREQGQFDETVRLMHQLAKANPTLAHEKTFILADSLMKSGEAEGVVEVLTNASQTGPLPPWAVVMLGQAYTQLEDYPNAVTQFEKALQEQPESSTAHYGLAQALARMGRGDEARLHRVEYARLKKEDMETFDRMRGHGTGKERHSADTLRPIIARFHFETGRLFAAQSQLDDAERHLLRAWALAPEQPQPRQLLEYLRQPKSAQTF